MNEMCSKIQIDKVASTNGAPLRCALATLGRWAVRWLELLGQNPSPARDHGVCAWQYLRPVGPVATPPTTPPPSFFVDHADDPAMPAGLSV